MATILVIDDNDTVREGVAAVVSRMGHKALEANSGNAGLKVFDGAQVDMVITDLKMDGLDGMGVLRAVKGKAPDVPVLMITAFGTIETAVQAIKAGAQDFVVKPFTTDMVRTKVEQALDWRRLQEENARLFDTAQVLSARDLPPPGTAYEGMVGDSRVMTAIFQKVDKVAASDANVHIYGESGTGKELVAQAIHNRSRRGKGPFIKVNCAAIPETLLESELFGHEKGAFTGAIKLKRGRFELADKGTLFLDEIGEIPAAMQVKLLRVLQEKEFERVGGERSIKVDVRVVSATNRDLEKDVKEGRFREDLFYRLHIVPLTLPPLRERTDDIIPLARHFVEKLRRRTNPAITGLSPAAESHLRAYRYPGNVRELENIIEQAMVFASPPKIDVTDLPLQVSGAKPKENSIQIPSLDMGLNEFLETAERQMILAAYEASGGVKTETARRLKIKTSALYYKLEKYGVGTVAGRNLGEAPPEDEDDGGAGDSPP